MRDTVFSVVLSADGKSWTARLVPEKPNEMTKVYGYGDDWRKHINQGDWRLADPSWLIDFRALTPTQVTQLLRLPCTDWRVPRGMIQRLTLSSPPEYAPIDWDAPPHFGARSLDAVHPADHVEMVRRLGIPVTKIG